MIQIFQEKINDIPSLIVVHEEYINKPLPVVTYYHGFNGDKESSLTLAYKLAMKGHRVVLPDSILHGDRRQNITETELALSFWDIVIKNVDEMKVIKQYLEEENLLLDGKFGVAGTSMGGITTCAALTQYDWIKAAAVLMGTPHISDYAKLLIDQFNKMNEKQVSAEETEDVLNRLKKYDLSLNEQSLNNRPLLFWHGEKDDVIPAQHSESFFSKMEKQYEPKENIAFYKEKDRIHHLSRLSMTKNTEWFTKHL